MRLVGGDTLQIFVRCRRAPQEGEGGPLVPRVNDLDGPRDKDGKEVAEKMGGLE